MRIFVTVGAQMPFDRLIVAMDTWAAAHPEHQVLAQIGASRLRPTHIRWAHLLRPTELLRAYDEADAIVGHAGTGTLFDVLQRGKPLVVLPRRADRRETRNDHQLATAKRFAERFGVTVAWDERELPAKLAALSSARPSSALGKQAGGPLVRAIAAYIND